jgi:hypothetical protein
MCVCFRDKFGQGSICDGVKNALSIEVVSYLTRNNAQALLADIVGLTCYPYMRGGAAVKGMLPRSTPSTRMAKGSIGVTNTTEFPFIFLDMALHVV